MKLLANLLLFLLWSIDRALSQDVCEPEDVTRIRLSAGPRDSVNEGAVQICLSSSFGHHWFYITATGWGDTEATVACRELSLYNTAATGTSLRLTNLAITITNTANCNGEENQLHSNCFPDGTLGVDGRRDVAMVVCNCTNGEVQLVDGANYREGRVEVCVDGRWGTVCGPNWGEREARLVCEALGLPTINATIQSFGEGSGPIFDCLMGSCTPSTCTHSDDTGVRCLEFEEACAVTVEEQSITTCTTQGTRSTTEPANGTNAPQSAIANVNTALAVLTALLAAALLAVIIGWIVTCVRWKCSQSKRNSHIVTGNPRNERQLDNPVYDGSSPRSGPHPQNTYSSVDPAYAQVNADQGTGYDVINRGGAPRPHPSVTPIGSHDQNGDQTYSTLDETAEL